MNDESSPPKPAQNETAEAEQFQDLDASQDGRRDKSPLKSMIDWLRGRTGETARDVLEDLIEEAEEGEASLGADERQLLLNILELKDQTVADVMVPRVDIIAAKADATLDDLIALITEEAHSRMPVYRETLDDAFGIVHVKDVLVWRGRDEDFSTSAIVRPVLFVAPSMQVLELLLEMRAKRVHMALVVDEFGGIDGLATIEDLVEEIVGEIEDEFDEDEKPVLEKRADGSWDAGARTPLEDLEATLQMALFSADERDEIDTLGGLVFSIAGRVPSRGELLTHQSGLEFEVVDVDPRRIKRLRLRVPHSMMDEAAVQDQANTANNGSAQSPRPSKFGGA
ncbi:hemolysin family protein [Magnetovibrio sp.]|uniref:hemolysin family protein n=1 Tax=Magnetovibrio sp. TaxID=2024836 RepID=UPI002F9406FD